MPLPAAREPIRVPPGRWIRARCKPRSAGLRVPGAGFRRQKGLVRKGGFEPPRREPPPPQDGVSTSSTTSARGRDGRSKYVAPGHRLVNPPSGSRQLPEPRTKIAIAFPGSKWNLKGNGRLALPLFEARLGLSCWEISLFAALMAQASAICRPLPGRQAAACRATRPFSPSSRSGPPRLRQGGRRPAAGGSSAGAGRLQAA